MAPDTAHMTRENAGDPTSVSRAPERTPHRTTRPCKPSVRHSVRRLLAPPCGVRRGSSAARTGTSENTRANHQAHHQCSAIPEAQLAQQTACLTRRVACLSCRGVGVGRAGGCRRYAPCGSAATGRWLQGARPVRCANQSTKLLVAGVAPLLHQHGACARPMCDVPLAAHGCPAACGDAVLAQPGRQTLAAWRGETGTEATSLLPRIGGD